MTYVIIAHLPTFYAAAQQSAIRSIAWIRAPSLTGTVEVSSKDPHVIVSASYDGSVYAMDTRAPCGNAVYRTRGMGLKEIYDQYYIELKWGV